MIEVDLHSHSSFSLCGIHSFMEMLTAAKAKGLKALAITDHGKELGGKLNSVFYERLINPVEGIQLLKGVECNVLNDKGNIDYPHKFNKFIDIILLGIHPNIEIGRDKKQYTKMLIKSIKKNPYIDIITHPVSREYPLDLEALAKTAFKHDIILELNNSKLHLKRIDEKAIFDFLNICKKTGCKIAINSDAHVIDEIGRDDEARKIIKDCNFPGELIVNNNAKKAFDFLDERKKRREKFI